MTVTVEIKHGGLLTNLEVLEVLRSRGADPEVAANPPRARDAAPCEIQTCEALKNSPCGNQSREILQGLFTALEGYGLTKAERQQIANLRPASLVELHLFCVLIPRSSILPASQVVIFVLRISKACMLIPRMYILSDTEIIEDCEERYDEEQLEALLAIVEEHLGPVPEEEGGEEQEEPGEDEIEEDV